MSAKRLGIALVVVALLVIAVIILVPVLAAVRAGDKAPDFQLGSVDGKSTIKLSDAAGKPTLIVFWASWCPHCRTELPHIQKIYNDLQPKGLSVIGVSFDRSIADARDYLKSHSITFPNAYAGTSSAANRVASAYGVSGIPALYVIDKNGVVRKSYAGEVSPNVLREDLANVGAR